ncbi:hypothetical protein BAE46_13210 [Glaciecola punicea]|jgi:hypothetical protein|uniref:hypothetical protein n=1 Tax=Glaciecola punicea TaxID=56804 RepID=UPI000871D26D|nr:hypothetical protein [Glaciecola punicea]OFA29841.1 hypothetical protein BAE46_13210 [Glaciecola punicea]
MKKKDIKAPFAIVGKIHYTSLKEGREQQERGREAFRIDIQDDGSKTVSAHGEIDDEPMITRDVFSGLNSDLTPQDCFVRISVGNEFRGSAWFTFEDDRCECEVLTSIEGRLSQTVKLSKKATAFGNHAMVNDGLLMSQYNLEKGPGTQIIKDLPLSSPDHRGATGPMLFLVDVAIEYVGKETLTVTAGTFEALHFKIVDVPGLPLDHPEYHIWCTSDGQYILLKATVGGYMQTHYELTELAYVPIGRSAV